jgi:hypothetical protein
VKTNSYKLYKFVQKSIDYNFRDEISWYLDVFVCPTLHDNIVDDAYDLVDNVIRLSVRNSIASKLKDYKF